MSYLLIGLGNSGDQYKESRHNAGFIFINDLVAMSSADSYYHSSDFLMWKYSCQDDDVYLVKPLTFMNLSGSCLKKVFFKSGVFSYQRVCVICDNMDLDLGCAKLKKGGGSAGQKGLQNIIDISGMSDFWRLYIGIGRPQDACHVSDYVLSSFTQSTSRSCYLNTCKDLARVFYSNLQSGYLHLQQVINSKWKNVF